MVAPLQVSQKMAVDINDFFSSKGRFLANLAAALGIPEGRLRIVRVVPGSTVVDYQILEVGSPLSGLQSSCPPSWRQIWGWMAC